MEDEKIIEAAKGKPYALRTTSYSTRSKIMLVAVITLISAILFFATPGIPDEEALVILYVIAYLIWGFDPLNLIARFKNKRP
jgi:hypothetical protein